MVCRYLGCQATFVTIKPSFTFHSLNAGFDEQQTFPARADAVA